MRLEYLQYLKAIADSNSISLASNRLFISQQALSKAIQMFEAELDTQLLIRVHQGVKLTEEGEYVLQKAEHILQQLQEMEEHFSQKNTAKITGQIKIMTTPFFLDHILPKVIGKFYKKYPKIRLDISNGNEQKIVTAVQEQQIDLGIFCRCYINNVPHNEITAPLEFVPFSKHYFQAIISSNSSLAKLDTLSMQQLAKQPVLLTATNTLEDYNLFKVFQSFGATDIRAVNGYGIFTQMISSDLGVSLTPTLPNYFFLEKLDGVTTRPISNNLHGYNGYLYNKEHFDNPCLNYFIEELYNRSNAATTAKNKTKSTADSEN